MSNTLSKLIWDCAPELKDTGLVVMLALAEWADEDGFCWPSVATLARRVRKSERNVRYALDGLVKDGYVRIEEHRGRGHVNGYYVNVSKLQVLKGKVQPLLQVLPTIKPAKSDIKPATLDLKPAIAIASRLFKDQPVDQPVERATRKPAKETGPKVAIGSLTPSLLEWAGKKYSQYSHADLEDMAERCADWHRANDKPIKDWEAALRNWVRREKQINPTGANGNGANRAKRESVTAHNLRVLEGLYAEEQALRTEKADSQSPRPGWPIIPGGKGT